MTLAEQLELVRQWTSLLSPSFEATEEEQESWYVDFDSYKHENEQISLRGPSATDSLRLTMLAAVGARQSARAGGNQSAQLLAGYRGTGKTTELYRLGRSLRQQGFEVLHIDMEDYLSRNVAPEVEQLAFALLAALQERAEALHLGRMELDWWKRFVDVVKRVGIDLSGELNLAGVKASIKRGDPSLRERLAAAHRERETLRGFVHGCVAELIREAGSRGHQVAILVDGLEKIDTDISRVYQEYQHLSRVFAENAHLWSLPGCHVVYVVPPFISTYQPSIEQEYGGLVHLVNVKVHDQQRVSYRLGRAALTEVANHRVNLTTLFGKEGVERCMDPILTASGGLPRRVFQILTQVVKRAIITPFPLSESVVRLALEGMRSPHEMLPAATMQALVEVTASRSLVGLSPEAHNGLAHAMDSYLILSYNNGEPWFDVTPSRWSMVDKYLALRASAAASR